MQERLYALSIRAMYLGMLLVSSFNKKARLWIRGQKRPLDFSIPKDRDVVWFHCASLGEFDQGLPVMKAYKDRFPTSFIVVTFFSPSGMEHYHKREHPAEAVCYLPLDTSKNARLFVEYIQPKHVFFVKYEYWHYHLLAAKNFGAKCFGVSTLFRPNQRFFKKGGAFFRSTLALFEHFYVQNDASFQLLKSIGFNNATVTGDTRYDRMASVVTSVTKDRKIADFVKDRPTLICGSTWLVDEKILFPALEKLKDKYKIIIAPHSISEETVDRISAYFKNDVERYSSYSNGNKDVLILDTIGQLTSAYSSATIAYVGGGFTGKLHNILEPGAFGVPVIIGSKHERFPEAQLFLDRGVLKTVNTTEEFEYAFDELIAQKETIKESLTQIFIENKGAADRIVNTIF